MTLKDRLTSIFDVFSRRSPPRGPEYKPDVISERLRNRIFFQYRDLLAGRAPSGASYAQEFWDQVRNSLEYLHGRVRLAPNVNTQTPTDDVLAFLQHCSAGDFFDFIDLSFRVDCMWRILHDRNELVEVINELFRIEGAPYRLTPAVTREEPNSGFSGRGTTIHTVAWPKVVRAEDEVTFTEAIAPALSVLSAPHFEAANLEFRGALDEYRKGQYGECLTKCGSSFESVMKVICKRYGWPFDERKDTAAALLKVVVSNSTLDPFFEQPLMLIATMRNRLSTSHGGGTAVRSVERHVAQYAITSTAAAIVLLVHEIGG